MTLRWPRLFVHVPKTAGTSFRVALERGLEGRILADYGPDSPETSAPVLAHVYRTPDRRRLVAAMEATGVGFLCGHFPYAKYADLFPASSVVTFVREPVARVASEYGHFVRHLGYRGTFGEFLSMERNRDLQSRFLAGLDLSEVGLVGVTERYEDSLRLLGARLGLSVDLLELNTNPDKDPREAYRLTRDELAAAREANAVDRGLWEAARRFLDHRLGAIDRRS